MSREKVRVLVAKPGLDGHDRGAKVVARALRDAGMEVIYTGIRQTPEMIVEVALQEDVDVLGLSIMSGAHLPLCGRMAEELRAAALDDVIWIAGGNVPRRDHEALAKMGVDGIFPTGSEFADIVQFIRDRVKS